MKNKTNIEEDISRCKKIIKDNTKTINVIEKTLISNTEKEELQRDNKAIENILADRERLKKENEDYKIKENSRIAGKYNEIEIHDLIEQTIQKDHIAKANKYDNLVKEIEEQCKRDIEQARKEYKITLSDRQDGIREEAQNILELLDKEKGENIMCEYFNAKVYVKTQKIMKNILAPLTHTEELRQELEDLTGERYLEVKANYCFMCGRKLTK